MIEQHLGVSQKEAVAHYIGDTQRAPFYQKAFAHYNTKGFHLIWSWWAFFLGTFFMLYRKLYLESYVALIPTLSIVALRMIDDTSTISLEMLKLYYLLIAALLTLPIYTKLYRELKIYLVLNIFLALLSSYSMLPTLISAALNGSFIPYFIYLRYQRVLGMAQHYEVQGREVLTALYDLGGINRWVYILVALWALFVINYF